MREQNDQQTAIKSNPTRRTHNQSVICTKIAKKNEAGIEKEKKQQMDRMFIILFFRLVCSF